MEVVTGVINGVFRRGSYVKCDNFEDDLFCGIAKTFRPPEGAEASSPLAIGDVVSVALTRDDHVSGDLSLDRNRMDGMIVSREPRSTMLARPQPISRKRKDEYVEKFTIKVIAANMDTLLIVAASQQPALRPRLIERFLIAAQRGDMKPVLAINKIDLGIPDDPLLNDLAEMGLEIIYLSAATGEGLDKLRERLSGHKCVLAGASGVGKSTIVNAILPHVEVPTRTVRGKDKRGRHTTSQAKIYDLDCGGKLVDTPGIRELGVNMDAGELCWYFPEIEAVAPDCKFRDCTHTHEPGCAVQAAVENGDILPRRFESYLRILESIT